MGQYLLILLVTGATLVSTAIRVAVLACVADLATAWILARCWRRSVAVAYLIMGLPLVPFLYLRLDWFVVLIAVAGMALLRSGGPSRERLGGVLLACGALLRAWPAVFVPAAGIAGRRRGAGWAVVIIGISVALWQLWGGPTRSARSPRSVAHAAGVSGARLVSRSGS